MAHVLPGYFPPVVLAGLQGSRKTAYAVERVIIPALQAGRRVFTNIELISDLKDDPNYHHLTDAALLAKIPDCSRGFVPSSSPFNNSVLVIDEAGVLFAAGRSGDFARPSYKLAAFMALCRHAGCIVVLTCQAIEQVARCVLDVCYHHYHFVNLTARFSLPFVKTSRMMIFQGWRKTADIRKGWDKPDNVQKFRPDPSTYSHYNSVVVDALHTLEHVKFKFTRANLIGLFVLTVPLALVLLLSNARDVLGLDLVSGLNEDSPVLAPQRLSVGLSQIPPPSYGLACFNGAPCVLWVNRGYYDAVAASAPPPPPAPVQAIKGGGGEISVNRGIFGRPAINQ